MDFLIDAQLPRRLSYKLRDAGHDAVHTLDLLNGNHTSDTEISRVADAEERIVVTKDADFVASHVLRGSPAQLLLVSTGNVSNAALEAVMIPRLREIEDAFAEASLVEIAVDTLIVRG